MNILEYCSDKNVFLYGAGEVANTLYEFLKVGKVNVKGFVISDEEKKGVDEIDGVHIFYLTELLDIYDLMKDRMILAVSRKHQEEVISNLEKVGITSYYLPGKDDVEWKDKSIRNIGILDTRISDENHGNEIIMQAVYGNLYPVLKDDFLIKFPYWDEFLDESLRNMQRCKYLFLGGGNVLTAEMDQCKYLGINERNINLIENKIVLMGVGWWRYEGNPNAYTKELLKRALNKEVLHSVRDGYTERKLRSFGINNVINTGCPTIWKLNYDFCRQIPRKKANSVLLMFTPRKEKEIDRYIIDIVRKNYKNKFFWVQGPEDYQYIKSICEEANLVSPLLSKLENFLGNYKDIDYVGTRLHGGIKCIQHKKRAVIIAIDNRAQEMKKDFNLPVVLPQDISSLDAIINAENETNIHINENKIREWLNQFI